MAEIKTWSLCLIGLFLLSVPFVKGESEESADDPNDEYHDDYDSDRNKPLRPIIITSKPENIVVDEGGEIRLLCNGEGLDQAGIIWSRKENDYLSNDGINLKDDRFKVSETDPTLYVNNVNLGDAGNYTCQVGNQSVTHIVIVRAVGPPLPRLTLAPSPTTVANQGETVYLTCTAQSESKQLAFFWQKKAKDGKTGVEIKDTMLSSTPDKHVVNTLKLDNISYQDAGEYVCTYQDEKNTVMEEVRVEVNYPPVVEVKSDSIHSPLDKAVEFRCHVHGQPQPTQTWYRNVNNVLTPVKQGSGYRLIPGHHTITLHIQHVKESDYGIYTCVATNTFGQNGTANIQLTGAPSQPSIIEDKTMLGTEHMSYQLVWKVDSSIPIDDSVLRYRKVGGNWTELRPIMVTKIPNQAFAYEVSYTLKNLASNSEYEAVLLSHNTNGWSDPSRTHKFPINGKSYQPLESNSGKAPFGGSTSLLSLSALFLVLMKTMSSWQ